jgi:hypothetical protein
VPKGCCRCREGMLTCDPNITHRTDQPRTHTFLGNYATLAMRHKQFAAPFIKFSNSGLETEHQKQHEELQFSNS